MSFPAVSLYPHIPKIICHGVNVQSADRLLHTISVDRGEGSVQGVPTSASQQNFLHEGGVCMSGAVGGYFASAAFVLVLFILLVIILRAGY